MGAVKLVLKPTKLADFLKTPVVVRVDNEFISLSHGMNIDEYRRI